MFTFFSKKTSQLANACKKSIFCLHENANITFCGVKANLVFFFHSALTEKIVAVLPIMKCPHRIEPHQIQGLDFIHIFPVIQVWYSQTFYTFLIRRPFRFSSVTELSFAVACQKINGNQNWKSRTNACSCCKSIWTVLWQIKQQLSAAVYNLKRQASAGSYQASVFTFFFFFTFLCSLCEFWWSHYYYYFKSQPVFIFSVCRKHIALKEGSDVKSQLNQKKIWILVFKALFWNMVLWRPNIYLYVSALLLWKVFFS